MNTILYILIAIAVVATVVALVRGIITFLQTTEEDLKGTGPSLSSQKQNRMMMMRILFQAIAIILVALLLLLGRGD